MKKNLGIIFGGKTSEYEVSLKSASYIIECLKDEFNLFMIGIDKHGQWFHYIDKPEYIINDEWHMYHKTPIVIDFNNKKAPILTNDRHYSLDCVFPVLHGRNGEDGSIQGLFQLLDIPLFGCGLLSSAISMDKDIAHSLVNYAGIKVTKSICLYQSNYNFDFVSYFLNEDYPLYVKPANEGSSCGMSKVIDESTLLKAVEYAFMFDNKVIIEKEVKGFEVGCSILGNSNLNVGSIDEVEFLTNDIFFDYNEKYTQTSTIIHPSARLSDEFKKEIEKTALKIYQVLNCSGMARVDLFIDGNDIYFNEVNTIPGLTRVSRYPRMIEQNGLSFKDLLIQSINELI